MQTSIPNHHSDMRNERNEGNETILCSILVLLSFGIGHVQANDTRLKQAYENHQSDVQVRGLGTVSRVLPDDNKGSRHQKFILRLDSGQTLLVAHNID